MTKRVLQLRTCPLNIGNTFIDLGAFASLKGINNVEVYLIGGDIKYSSWLDQKRNRIRWKFLGVNPAETFVPTILDRISYPALHNTSRRDYSLSNLFDMTQYLKADFLVISGAVLGVDRKGHGLPARTQNVLFKMKERGVRIILYGAGGETYSDFEINLASSFLSKLKPYALISSDKK